MWRLLLHICLKQAIISLCWDVLLHAVSEGLEVLPVEELEPADLAFAELGEVDGDEVGGVAGARVQHLRVGLRGQPGGFRFGCG